MIKSAAMRALPLAALLALGSCVSVRYVRTRIHEPVPAPALEALQPGRDDLGVCLAALGAPLEVLEYRGSGMALLWTWPDVDDWSIDLSIPIYNDAATSLELDLTDTDQPGCVLWFGPDLVLESWRMGTLGDILRGRVRPEVIE